MLQLVIIIPAVQNKIKNASVSVLQEQLNSDVTIGQFRLGFPKKLKVSEILVSQNESDTLLYLGEFSVNIRIFPIIRKQIILQNIELKNGIGDFGGLIGQLIIDTIPDKNTAPNTPSWELIINKLSIESCYFEYRDEEDMGFELIMDIGKAGLHLGTFNLDTLISCKSVDLSRTNVSFEWLNIPENYLEEDTSVFEFADIYIEKARLSNSEFAYIDTAGAICGIAPFPNSSGTSIKGKTQISHLANKKIKSLLDQCAKNAIMHNYEMKVYYETRIEKGKQKMNTINIIRNKLLARIFAVVKRESPYVDFLKYAA